ncbi:MAG: hypothetical protein FWG36_08325 [Oscillospiraceae bacterium]|nr:hypothetical protein [Oscillospiraceae bacterium]
MVDVISTLGVLLSGFYVFGKAVKYPAPFSHKIMSVLWCLLLAFLYAANPLWIPILIVRPIHCVLSIMFIMILTKIKWDMVVSAYLVSFGISYELYLIAKLIIALVTAPFASSFHVPGTPIDYNQPFYIFCFSLVFALQLLLPFLFFRVKRFKNGFPYLFKDVAVVISLLTTGAVLVFVTGIQVLYESDDVFAINFFFIGVLTVGVGVVMWIRRRITMMYKLRIAERKIKQLEDANAKLKHDNERLGEINDTLLVANHKIIHRLTALESGNANPEDVKRLSEEYHLEIDKLTKKPLPSAGIESLDMLFSIFEKAFTKSKIDFYLEVNGDIPHMTEHIIPKGKLETMVGDHLQDALNAVNAGDNPYRSVRAAIGRVGDFCEFSVHDSGIPFEVDTLSRLGTERVTTHKDGSGIGFMTTFETMRECGASLIISENPPSEKTHSKSVTIRFDGKNQYIIETHRPDDFPPSDRYIVRPVI